MHTRSDSSERKSAEAQTWVNSVLLFTYFVCENYVFACRDYCVSVGESVISTFLPGICRWPVAWIQELARGSEMLLMLQRATGDKQK